MKHRMKNRRAVLGMAALLLLAAWLAHGVIHADGAHEHSDCPLCVLANKSHQSLPPGPVVLDVPPAIIGLLPGPALIFPLQFYCETIKTRGPPA